MKPANYALYKNEMCLNCVNFLHQKDLWTIISHICLSFQTCLAILNTILQTLAELLLYYSDERLIMRSLWKAT